MLTERSSQAARRAPVAFPEFLKNALLVLVSVALCTALAEGFVRWLEPSGDSNVGQHLDDVARAPGVDRAWYFTDPPPLGSQDNVPPAWRALFEQVKRSGGDVGTRLADLFKAWNSAFVGDPCSNRYLRDAPGHLYVYDPPDGRIWPHYRYLPNATTPLRLTTNAYGFRGPPVPFVRKPKTVRIAFIGASTTVESHFFPFSYPEYIAHWLALWAKAKGLDIRFEVLNAGRDGIGSTDIAAIVRQEVVPLRPDLVVYYGQANQFDLRSLVPRLPSRPAPTPTAAAGPDLLGDAARYSMLARRLLPLLGFSDLPPGAPADGREWPKPAYELVWPAGLDEQNPDITRRDLPVNLSTILGDLDDMRTAIDASGGELAIASYEFLVWDGMVLDPRRHAAILKHLNQGFSPYRYRDLERLANFETRVMARYAAAHRLPFFDVAHLMPRDPDLHADAIHDTPVGVRLRAWTVFQQLVPLIEDKLASGAWPKRDPGAGMPATHPAFATPPREITFTCTKTAG